MTDRRAYREPGDGPLARVSALAYWLVVVMLLVVVAVAPGYLPLMLLERDVSNIPLVALCLLPVGPAYCAAVFALHRRENDDDLRPARAFLRGYRRGLGDALRLWAPALGVLALLTVNAALVELAPVPDGFELVMVVLGALVLAWAVHALTIAALFSFRSRDVARLAGHYLVAKPLVTLGILSYVVLAGAVVHLVSDWALALLGSLLAAALLRNARPVLHDVTSRFTHPRPAVG